MKTSPFVTDLKHLPVPLRAAGSPLCFLNPQQKHFYNKNSTVIPDKTVFYNLTLVLMDVSSDLCLTLLPGAEAILLQPTPLHIRP